jgi:NTE family protein
MPHADFPKIFSSPAVKWQSTDGAAKSVKGAGLALSGGGYRAMLYHVGALRRLHEVGALRSIQRISSVSGGSIAAAVLAQAWNKLEGATVDVFESEVQDKLLSISEKRIDVRAGLTGLIRPGQSIAHTVAKRYETFFPAYSLADLPDAPRFVFCATNLGTGALVRFAKPYTVDQKVGVRFGLDLPISDVLAASAAFPPVLSPMRINLSAEQALTEKFDGDTPELYGKSFAQKLELSDGGVYDNLGIQPLRQYQTILVSDGGGPFKPEDDVKRNWVEHMLRNWLVTDNQVRSLRRSDLIAAFKAERRNGAFWGVSTDYRKYPVRPIPVDHRWAAYLQSIPTRLHPFDDAAREQLINFSYALTDAALRSYVIPKGAEVLPPTLPFPTRDLSKPPPRPAFESPPIWKVWK